jgi:putative ABC transport system permease protein
VPEERAVIAHLRTALDLFRTQKVRFLLTVSGIVVGVASLVVLASLLEIGGQTLARASGEATGDDVITVSDDWDAINNDPNAKRIDRNDRDALEESTLLPGGTTVTATYGMDMHEATHEGKPFDAFAMGIGADAFDVYTLEVARGRAFVASEYEGARRVAIVGSNVRGGAVSPGDTIRVEGSPFTVVGVMKKKPDMGPGGPWSWNNRILFPARTYSLFFDPSERPSEIVVKVTPPASYEGMLKDYVLGVRDIVETVLMRSRKTKSFEFRGVEDSSGTEALVFATIHALLYLTTLFSMLVGAINIMNIMLVTVTERTREIGVRRALGATRRDIVGQFLAETVAVTLVGAVVGLIVAMVLLALATFGLDQWVGSWPFHVEAWSIGAALALSSVIGVGFGLYPAWIASRLDPVEALRFE